MRIYGGRERARQPALRPIAPGRRGRSRSLAQPTLVALLLDKIREQVERTQHLLTLIPADKLAWRPDLTGSAFSLGLLLGHLLECLAGFCAVLYRVQAERLAHFGRLKDLPVNHPCGIEEARERLADYLARIEEGFALLTDDQLALSVPTVFLPEGEPVLTLLLGNLEHLINHKFQIFFYLKMIGVPVATADLYRLRGAATR